MSWRTES